MNRYLGTKTKILTQFLSAISNLDCVSRVCDIFAGSLAVSLFLKRRGYGVIANDINPLSYAYARAYLTSNSVPQFDVGRMLSRLKGDAILKLRRLAHKLIENQRSSFEAENRYGEFQSWAHYAETFDSMATVLAFLQCSPSLSHAKAELRSDILEHYTKTGGKSHFRSVRGRRGKRNYFSASNAKRLDFILSQIRFWNQADLLDDQSKFTLLSIVLDSMERCVNIQGTYHDFPRNRFEERAKRPLSLIFPNYFGLLHSSAKHLASCEDSLNFIRRAPAHDVLYVDPPYNFRQYTAYYHLPNFFVRYPDIQNLDRYLSHLEYVRGQNMTDDFTSPFSNRDQFLPALQLLVERARCKHVVLSYFDGVNHWNDFLADDNSAGYRLIESFFNSSLFVRGSLRVVPVDRTNYQSQNGCRGKRVTEYLFVAQRSEEPTSSGLVEQNAS